MSVPLTHGGYSIESHGAQQRSKGAVDDAQERYLRKPIFLSQRGLALVLVCVGEVYLIISRPRACKDDLVCLPVLRRQGRGRSTDDMLTFTSTGALRNARL